MYTNGENRSRDFWPTKKVLYIVILITCPTSLTLKKKLPTFISMEKATFFDQSKINLFSPF